MKTITPLGYKFIKATTRFDMDYEELRKGDLDTMTIKDYLLNEGRSEGLSQGRAEGITQGITQGRAEGRVEEKLIQQLKMLKKFIEKNMSEEEIMDFLDINKEELENLKKQL